MTVAWAGPYVGNLLSPLGVDVIKLEAQNPFDGWRAHPKPYDHGMRPGPGSTWSADNRWFEASGLFNSLNRGKRGCVLSLAGEEGREVFLDHGGQRPMPSWPTSRLTFCLGSASTGPPWRRSIPAWWWCGCRPSGSTAPTAMLPATARSWRRWAASVIARATSTKGPASPTSTTQTRWPGSTPRLGLLAGLHRRDIDRCRGIELDMSHQEATWNLHGDALVLADREGRNVGRTGNRQPGIVVSGMFATADDRWVAVVGDDPASPTTPRASSCSPRSARRRSAPARSTGRSARSPSSTRRRRSTPPCRSRSRPRSTRFWRGRERRRRRTRAARLRRSRTGSSSTTSWRCWAERPPRSSSSRSCRST